jgi:hypothetical protein
MERFGVFGIAFPHTFPRRRGVGNECMPHWCHKQEDARCAYVEGYGPIVHHFTRLWEVGAKMYFQISWT